jgi:hypothetical protein
VQRHNADDGIDAGRCCCAAGQGSSRAQVTQTEVAMVWLTMVLQELNDQHLLEFFV